MKYVKTIRYMGVSWAVLGVSGLLLFAIARMFILSVGLLDVTLSAVELAALILWVAGMVYAEGYRGFHRRFSPRFAARALYLTQSLRPIDLALAPLFCMGYFHASKKRIATTWLLTLGIVLLAVLAKNADQPWRSIISSGVLAGLLYGLVSVFYFTTQTLRAEESNTDAELS